jgi:hypothetical protein
MRSPGDKLSARWRLGSLRDVFCRAAAASKALQAADYRRADSTATVAVMSVSDMSMKSFFLDSA